MEVGEVLKGIRWSAEAGGPPKVRIGGVSGRGRGPTIKGAFYCGVHTLRDPSGYPSGGSPFIGTVTPGPNWSFLSPP